jgi:60 kDa SS-A/Ro ribonucleoprotein
MDYTKHLRAHQRERAKSTQTKNAAGGYTFQLDALGRLQRFLILGSEGGTYYANERDLTRDNVATLDGILDKAGEAIAAVRLIEEVSTQGRAPKNDPAIFALAYITANSKHDEVRAAAYKAMPRVCRTGTHLFQWADLMKKLGSSLGSSGAKRAISRWYLEKDPQKLALQVTKYKQRSGWTHRDVMLQGHVHPPGGQSMDARVMRDVLQYAAKPDTVEFSKDSAIGLLYAAQALPYAKTEAEVVKLITEYKAPRELVPTEHLNSPAVWEALLEDMPMTATVRNLGKMTSVGLLKPLSNSTKKVLDRLGNAEQVLRSRMHPLNVLVAKLTYEQGRGTRGSLSWDVVGSVVGALEGAFYSAFGNVRPSGKRTLVAVDVSASMDGCWGFGVQDVCGCPALTPRIAAACMAMVTLRTEPLVHIVGFSHKLVPINVRPSDSLETVVEKMKRVPMGGTDAAQPMLYAAQEGINVDGFVSYTDNETWAGYHHPFEALNAYRKKQGIDARMVTVAFTATESTIGDTEDTGSLDVVGFDTAAPQLIADFVGGQV